MALAPQLITTNFEHIPIELLAHQLLGIASCRAAEPLIEHALREGWSLDADKITCPVRIVWGTEDKLLPWPQAAARYRNDWLPQRRARPAWPDRLTCDGSRAGA